MKYNRWYRETTHITDTIDDIVYNSEKMDSINKTDSKLLIKRAEIEDVNEITILEQATSNTAWSEDALAHDIDGNDIAYVIVARTDAGVLVSYLDAWIVAGEIQLNNIAVDESFRRQHIAEKMINRMIEDNSNCDKVLLEVRSGNEAGRGLYSKLGFEVTGARENYYEDNGETAILMEKSINKII